MNCLNELKSLNPGKSIKYSADYLWMTKRVWQPRWRTKKKRAKQNTCCQNFARTSVPEHKKFASYGWGIWDDEWNGTSAADRLAMLIGSKHLLAYCYSTRRMAYKYNRLVHSTIRIYRNTFGPFASTIRSVAYNKVTVSGTSRGMRQLQGRLTCEPP